MLYRLSELKILVYRLLLAYVVFTISRILFIVYNLDVIPVSSLTEAIYLCYLGIRFDTTSILYLVSPFIILSLLPGSFIFNKVYQKIVKGFYFFGGSLGLFYNFIDIVYYPFNLMRMNANFLESIENEENKLTLLLHFSSVYFYLIVLFGLIMLAWVYFYDRQKLTPIIIQSRKNYYLESVILFFGVITLSIGGIRGGNFKKSTRPIGTIHAMEKVENPQHADIVLNTPFSIFRTLGKVDVQRQIKHDEPLVKKVLRPIKFYPPSKQDSIKPNVVLFILESFGREYWGTLNEETNIPNFESFTPFLDSLGKHSLRFPNFYANGRKSIHAMPAILAGIPSFKTGYTTSPFVLQPVESVVSILNKQDYDTSFFHGAPNGSMGLLGFSSVLGYDHYYGFDEYGKKEDFDGYWGIWDHLFLDFVKETIDDKEGPFFSTIFTVSSHEPYIVPDQFKGKFKKGYNPMHQSVGYTDFSLQQFFEKAKQEDWYENTLFIFTADHVNKTHFPFYEQTINRFANPLMIFSPKGLYKGVNRELGQHMDIYPTIVDLIGYDQPFRSWGQSLISSPVQEPYVINFFGGSSYFIMDDKTIIVSDGDNVKGVYNASDKGLENNLMNQLTNPEVAKLQQKMEMFIQDYMNRIIDGNLSYESETLKSNP